MSLSLKSSFATGMAHKRIEPEALGAKVAALRNEGKTIATLNGSFDLMHAGHLEMIYQASLQADVLIVALNTDRSIQQYKSPLRPIIPLEYRLQMMAALEMVDFVTWFDETDPRKLLSLIQPDVHVNGAEYGENCIEAEVVRAYGGRIHIVQLIPGLSTSEILKKIVKTCA
ncbi:MAG: adenylyltransferase/cytidyltransferase family protein [Candidatus Melainabacteria bacterium]|nr:adenylyltransferase/cytidyltransferase family protein [Candidatus Melainabacteria bacterium]